MLVDATFHERKGEDGFDGGKNKIVETRSAGRETEFRGHARTKVLK
jgi:hypothetical protein